MTRVLSSAKSITHHHDRQLVDGALIYSLLGMLNLKRQHCVLRLYHVSAREDQLYVVLSAESDGRATIHEEIEVDPAEMPALMRDALNNNAVAVETAQDDLLGTIHYSWLPVSHDNDLLGCIELGMVKPLTQRQVTLLDGMRGLYANHLSLLNYSQIDTLTGLLNRKTFDDSLRRMLCAVRAKQQNKHMQDRRTETDESANWLSVIDIDHFKRINDAHGHLYGDKVLVQIADLMRKHFRTKDKLFRLGGEEFVVLLRDTSEKNANTVFERFRSAVEQYRFGKLDRVTLSIGFAQVYDSDVPTTLLGRADDALYYAKQHGRNQVRKFGSLPE